MISNAISTAIDYMTRLVTFNRIIDPDWEPTRHTFDGIRGKVEALRKTSVLHLARKLAREDGDSERLRTIRDDLIRARHRAGMKIDVELDMEAKFRRDHPIAPKATAAQLQKLASIVAEDAFEQRAQAFRVAQQKLLVGA